MSPERVQFAKADGMASPEGSTSHQPLVGEGWGASPGSEKRGMQQEGYPGTWESLSSPLQPGGRPHQPKARGSHVRDCGSEDRT